MSGLSNGSTGQSTIINIVEGTFRRQVAEGTPNSHKRLNKLGKEVHELSYTRLEGYIKAINIEDTENYGKRIHLTIQADKDYKLSMPYDNSLAMSIYKMLPNVNPAEQVSFELNRKANDEGKLVTSLFMSQNGASIKWAYTRANPNGMPDMKELTVNGKKVWDKTDQLNFLQTNSLDKYIAKIPSSFQKNVEVGAIEYGDAELEYLGEADPDDIGF